MNYKLLFAAANIASFLPNSGKADVTPAKRPNVVIILADDMGYGDISCYNQNQVKTPQIDNIAKEGVRFTDFYVPTPYCAPSRATLLTGRFPLRHGLVQNPAPDAGINDIGLDAREVTLGNLFQGAGYQTKCIGKWHLGHKPEYFPVNHGFDEYYGILYSNDMRPVQLIENRDTVEYPVDQRFLTQKYTAKALDFIRRNQNTPFFLYLAHAMPHKPLAASPGFYSGGDQSELYKSAIRELDWSTGEVINTLKELGILENTVLIFMSDNGPWYGGSTGGLKGMKATSWEGGTRVPFIIRYPHQFPQNKTVSTPCWSPDILPTLMKLANIETDPEIKLDGTDISKIIKGKSTRHSPVFTMKNSEIQTIRDGKWKLFVTAQPYYKEPDLTNWKDPRAPDGKTILAPIEQATPADYPGVKPEKMEGNYLLFDLEKDPAEHSDLSGNFPRQKEKMIRKYHRYLLSLTDSTLKN
jgi:arylsulfatase A-like enzyme